MEQKKWIKSDGEQTSREKLGGMQQMKGGESRIRVTDSPSLWLWKLQERRNMVMGFSHPAQSWVIGTIGKIEIWLTRSLEFLLLSMTQRDVVNIAAVATSRDPLARKFLQTSALLFIKTRGLGRERHL